jgi:hypothetical protein
VKSFIPTIEMLNSYCHLLGDRFGWWASSLEPFRFGFPKQRQAEWPQFILSIPENSIPSSFVGVSENINFLYILNIFYHLAVV